MDLEPVFGEGCLVVRTRDTVLAVGDLHLGFEDELQQKGFSVPSQTDGLADPIVEAVRDHDVDRIVLLGDVKHNIPYASYNEERELGRFFDRLLEVVDRVDIAKGNHDAAIEEHLPDGVHLRPPRGFTLWEAGFVHGHTWPDPDVVGREALILGHVHPAVAFTDHLGARQKEACWLRMPVTERFHERYGDASPLVVVVPAANPLLGGIAVNEQMPPGPLFQNRVVDLDEAQVTTLDGVDLGRIADLG